MTCRDEILATFRLLEARTGRDTFRLQEIIDGVLARTKAYEVSTIRTHVTSRLCADAPDNHAVTYDDLERVERGLYRRRQTT